MPYTVDRVTEDGARSHRLREIPGTVPPLTVVAPGCSFADRCPNVAADCRAAMPPLSELGPGHLVRCLHPFDGAPSS
jgi:oligopeptide/dipeptide ABC transporter ATP-binding protein